VFVLHLPHNELMSNGEAFQIRTIRLIIPVEASPETVFRSAVRLRATVFDVGS
jgi:hypothetical protein